MDTVDKKIHRIIEIAEELERLKFQQLEIPEIYARMLKWERQDGIIKAVPKKPLSMTAHNLIEKAFKKAGGAYVSNNGNHYYELVTERKLSPSSKIAVAYHELQKNGIFEEA